MLFDGFRRHCYLFEGIDRNCFRQSKFIFSCYYCVIVFSFQARNVVQKMQPAGRNPQDVPEVPPPCSHCQHSPCLLFQGLYLEMVERYESLVDSDVSTEFNNKQIRFILYRFATNWIHGFLGKGKRIKLPVCVRGEILDLAPQADHVYVGFRPSRTTNEPNE